MTHNVAALFGHADDTLLAWQQACVQAAETLQPPPDPERLAKALALAQDGAVSWRRTAPRRSPAAARAIALKRTARATVLTCNTGVRLANISWRCRSTSKPQPSWRPAPARYRREQPHRNAPRRRTPTRDGSRALIAGMSTKPRRAVACGSV